MGIKISNGIAEAYFNSEKKSSNKMIFVLGPVGLLMLLFNAYNTFGNSEYYIYIVVLSVNIVYFLIYHSQIVIKGKYMNSLISEFMYKDDIWIFKTFDWYFRKRQVIVVNKIIEVKNLNKSLFGSKLEVHKLTVLSDGKIKYIFIFPQSFENLEQIYLSTFNK
ncbi:hypothetical protein [Hymenobacter sp. BT730]|uniref:hypothetical protein n=1 Tax=Hymenobacter sp. BT730 TaxID=3063332 RepID=UPI0026DEB751|nr:hypothetical protein [Hymenobacter sp. BT730]